MKMFTMNEAAKLLAKELPYKTNQQWWGYLKWNPQRWKQQDGVLIQSRVVDGELMYTSSGLKAFVSLFTPYTYKEVA